MIDSEMRISTIMTSEIAAPLFRALDEKGYAGFFSMEPHLTDFAGFAALEQGETEKKASPAQGEIAFTAAYLCARGLMSL